MRAVNVVRLQILGDWLPRWFRSGDLRSVVDLGCGGGLMALPLAHLGCRVLGVDRSLPALREGKAQRAGRVEFVQGDLMAPPVGAGSADLVLLVDVLEHVEEPAAAICAAARLLRPGGRLFVNTINRTLRARLLAIGLAETLGLIPRGTHDGRAFVRPDELRAMTRAAGLVATDWCGEVPDLWASLRRRVVTLQPGRSLAVGYCAGFRKADA